MTKLKIDLWLDAVDIGKECELIFVDDGEQKVIPQEGDKKDIEVFEIGVSLPNKEIRRWTMNPTSQRAVARAYGMEPKEWVGKKVTVFTSKENVRGTMRDVIYARIPVKE